MGVPTMTELTPDECMVLVATVPLGRVGLSMQALPVVLPVNFVVVGNGIVFPSVHGTRLLNAASGAIVAFEADAYEPSGRCGWSVLIQGPASVITDSEEVARVSDTQIRRWAADGRHDRFVRIDATFVTGRRFVRS
jgi:uncharacterized protein